MAGRDEHGGEDLDDWFDESQLPSARPTRPGDRGARADTVATGTGGSDDWLGAGATRPPRRSRSGLPDALSEPRAIAAIVAVLVVLLVIGLAAGGVFSSSPPKPEPIITTHAVTTTATTTTKATTTSTTPVAAPTVPLKPGDSGAQVKLLQAALLTLGYAPGAVDGVYGTATASAVTQFQAAAGITQDGVVGPETRQALRTALATH